MVAKTPEEVIALAEQLHTELTEELEIDFESIPAFDIDMSIPDPPTDGPIFNEIPKIELSDLTTKQVDGTGVFDALMTTVNAHLEDQYDKGRISGADFAKVYVAAIEHTSQQANQFLLQKDRAYWESIGAQASAQIALAGRSRALAEMKIAQAQLYITQYEAIKIQLQTRTVENEFALSKMRLAEGYNNIVLSENQNKLAGEQFEGARAQTMDTRSDGTVIQGVFGAEKKLKDAQLLNLNEQVDASRAQTKDTLQDGTEIKGIIAVQKTTAEAQLDLTRAQVTKTEADAEVSTEHLSALSPKRSSHQD